VSLTDQGPDQRRARASGKPFSECAGRHVDGEIMAGRDLLVI
jgi:hypothetical protein